MSKTPTKYGAQIMTAKQPVAKKPNKNKAKAKKAAPSTALPKEGKKEESTILPRGQMRLPNGDIRLKSGTHDLGRTANEYDVSGAKIKLKGKVLVAKLNANWLNIGVCQKCGKPRPNGVNIHRSTDGMTVLTYECSNKKECDLGGLTYVQPHSKERFIFKEEYNVS